MTEIDQDDVQIGRILSRREVLVLFGAAGAATVLAACGVATSTATPGATSTAPGTAAGTATGTAGATATAVAAASSAIATAIPACIVRPALTEGPYFVDEKLERSDIRSDPSDGSVSEGVLFDLAFAVSQISGSSCTAFRGVLVDVWHCDGLGVYSDVSDQGFTTTGKKFLRGYQTTDANGIARFTTIFPGWYQGRAVHIHFKMRSDAMASSGHEFTSQLFFDEAMIARVFAEAPYVQKGTGWLKNGDDGTYNGGGSQLLLSPTGDIASGLAATFEVGLQVA